MLASTRTHPAMVPMKSCNPLYPRSPSVNGVMRNGMSSLRRENRRPMQILDDNTSFSPSLHYDVSGNKKQKKIQTYTFIYIYLYYIFFLWKYYTTPSCKFTESASQGAMASCSEISKLSKRLIPSTMRCAAVICKLSRKAPVQTSSSPILPCIQGWVAPVSGVWPRARRISVFPGRSP